MKRYSRAHLLVVLLMLACMLVLFGYLVWIVVWLWTVHWAFGLLATTVLVLGVCVLYLEVNDL